MASGTASALELDAPRGTAGIIGNLKRIDAHPLPVALAL
jgi:hypothetical protein